MERTSLKMVARSILNLSVFSEMNQRKQKEFQLQYGHNQKTGIQKKDDGTVTNKDPEALTTSGQF